MKSMHPIQIALFWIIRRKFAKYPGPPPFKNTKNYFISKIPEKPPKPDEIHVPNSDQICLDCSGKMY